MRVLVLAGTSEARTLCARLTEHPKITTVASLAGATDKPAAYAGKTRVGGFGGAIGLARYLRDSNTDVLVDATHPFAVQISANACAAAAQTNRPLLRLERPEWKARPTERWIGAKSIEEAAALLPTGAHAFLATGAKSLDQFARRADVQLTARVIDMPSVSPGHIALLSARPPFSGDDELDLFRKLHITHLVTKNAGGADGRTKLDAAALLGVEVIMIGRAPPGDGKTPRVETPEDAIRWLEAL
ncbi:MAG: cobalt-precorrin-6A reductase [Pseudomonadota bacterium]